MGHGSGAGLNLGYTLEVPKAEDLIRKGWHLWERRTREGLEKALACFEQAAHEDGPTSGRSKGYRFRYLLLCTYGMRPPIEMYPKFLEAHNRAVELRRFDGVSAIESGPRAAHLRAKTGRSGARTAARLTRGTEAGNHLRPPGAFCIRPWASWTPRWR